MIQTSVWFNPENGHQYEEGERGARLNDRSVEVRPDWAGGLPDFVFGPLSAWGGGECPVPPTSEVRCLFRGRRPYIGPAIYPNFPRSGQDAMWQHAPYPGRSNPASDIVSFQARIG